MLAECSQKTNAFEELFGVPAQIDFAFIINDAKPQLIQPATPAEHVAGEGFVCRKKDCDIDQ